MPTYGAVIVCGLSTPLKSPFHSPLASSVIKLDYIQPKKRKQQRREKPGHRRGRAHKAHNLFTHIAKYGESGETMHYSQKGSKGKKGGYLRCSLALHSGRTMNGKTCSARSIY